MDDPAKIGIVGCLSSCCSLRFEPEFSTVNLHAVEQASNFAGNSDDSSPPSFGFHQSYTPCLQAAPGDRAHEHCIGRSVERSPNIGVTSV
jgi:hypothetical protein